MKPVDLRRVTTYSMWSLFKNCRRACYWRYVRNLTPVSDDGDRPLRFGTLIHRCLELWHGGSGLPEVLDAIDGALGLEPQGEQAQHDRHYARAMMTAYAKQYLADAEPWKVVMLEKEFRGEITNPDTGAKSRSFVLAGKIDGLVRKPDGTHWLLEHKTASVIDGDYLGRLWMDFQIKLYSLYVARALGITVDGVIYNVLAKPKLSQRQGELEEDFQVRRADLIAKSKTGKTTAKRREPETGEDFEARLATWYAEPGRFHRAEIKFDRKVFAELQAELWELTKHFLAAKSSNCWYKNTSYCTHYNRNCPFFEICSSGDNKAIIDGLYQVRESANTELSGSQATTDNPGQALTVTEEGW